MQARVPDGVDWPLANSPANQYWRSESSAPTRRNFQALVACEAGFGLAHRSDSSDDQLVSPPLLARDALKVESPMDSARRTDATPSGI